jgi:hypothetical protein
MQTLNKDGDRTPPSRTPESTVKGIGITLFKLTTGPSLAYQLATPDEVIFFSYDETVFFFKLF